MTRCPEEHGLGDLLSPAGSYLTKFPVSTNYSNSSSWGVTIQNMSLCLIPAMAQPKVGCSIVVLISQYLPSASDKLKLYIIERSCFWFCLVLFFCSFWHAYSFSLLFLLHCLLVECTVWLKHRFPIQALSLWQLFLTLSIPWVISFSRLIPTNSSNKAWLTNHENLYTASFFSVLCFQKLSSLIFLLRSSIDTWNYIGLKQKEDYLHSMCTCDSPIHPH